MFDAAPPPKIIVPKPAIIRPTGDGTARPAGLPGFPVPAPLVAGGCDCTPDYANDGGMGDRTSSPLVTMYSDVPWDFGGSETALVDGVTTNDSGVFLQLAQAVTGLVIRADFNAINAGGVKIAEITAIMGANGAGTWGTWGVRAGNSVVSDDIVSPVTLNAGQEIFGLTDEVYDLSANANGYRYYELFGVSGAGASTARSAMDELHFKICSC